MTWGGKCEGEDDADQDDTRNEEYDHGQSEGQNHSSSVFPNLPNHQSVLENEHTPLGYESITCDSKADVIKLGLRGIVQRTCKCVRAHDEKSHDL